MNEHKILFTGSMGAGKTTAINAISEIPTVNTDVSNSDVSVDKPFTTVGLDFGELTLANGDKLRLFGTPGQVRFAFMWEILARGAIGVVVLIDNRSKDPAADLAMYLTHFRETILNTACVIGVGRTDTHPLPSIDTLAATAHSLGVLCPIFPVDVRDRAQVLMLMDLLVTQLENK
jgi:uncharacterized protein